MSKDELLTLSQRATSPATRASLTTLEIHTIGDALKSLLTEGQSTAWQDISTAPKGRKIIAGYFNSLGKWRSVMATYYPPKTLDADETCDDSDEDGYAPEGWYEESETRDTLLPLAGEQTPTHWHELIPAPPQEPRQ